MNCEAGDLAVVIKSTVKENVGKLVDVVKAYEPQDAGIVPTNEGHLWLCKSLGSDLAWESANGIGLIRQKEGPVPDGYLRPIRDSNPDESGDKCVSLENKAKRSLHQPAKTSA